MDPQKNVNPAASDEEQPTPPQADVPQQDASPGLDDSALGSSSPALASDVTPLTDTPDTGVTQEAPIVTPGTETATTPTTGETPVEEPATSTTPAIDNQPSLASEEPAVSQDATPMGSVAPPADSTPAGTTVTPTEAPLDPTVVAASDTQPSAQPAATAGGDKRTIVVLGAVAVVLLAAIAVLAFM